MALELTPEEQQRWGEHVKFVKRSRGNQGGRITKRGHRQKQRANSLTDKRKTPLRTKEVRKDICKEDGTWVGSVTRCQVNMNSGNMALQLGFIVRNRTVTIARTIEGVICD